MITCMKSKQDNIKSSIQRTEKELLEIKNMVKEI